MNKKINMWFAKARQVQHYTRSVTEAFNGMHIVLHDLSVIKLIGDILEPLPHDNISYCELIYAS
jgi:hypothetical protein